MIAVLYAPDTGVISQTMQGREANVAATADALGLSYLEVELFRENYDRTHRVVDGALTEVAGE